MMSSPTALCLLRRAALVCGSKGSSFGSATIRRTYAASFSTSTTASVCRRLEGRVAVVTASSDGIGKAIAARLGSEGASIVVSSRKEENVANTVAELRDQGMEASGIVCHVGKADHRSKLIDFAVSEYGAIDILVSNAAVNPFYGPCLEVSFAIFCTHKHTHTHTHTHT